MSAAMSGNGEKVGFKRLSMHELAIERVKKSRAEELHTTGFAAFIAKLAEEYAIDFGEDEFRRPPDAWSYIDDPRSDMPGTLFMFEVEDSNPLSVDKMRDYADYWHTLDFYDIDLRLFVYDLYATQEREINLADYFMMFIVRGHPIEGEVSV